MSLADRFRPRVCGGAPAFGLDGDEWIDNNRFFLWLAPRPTSPAVLWNRIHCGIFVRLHGLAMGGDVLERDDERQEQVWVESQFMADRIWTSYDRDQVTE